MIPISKPMLGKEEAAAVLDVLSSGMLAQGPYVERLEQGFREVTGARHAVAVSSGTSALHLALLAHGVGPGDEVVTTPFSFVATTNAILLCGARPVFADIDSGTFNIDPEEVAEAITSRTRAVLPVHLYGLPCEMPAIVEAVEGRGVAIIEDAAQAIGASIGGEPVGLRRTACFSLYATKNVTAGEGGMVLTDDDGVADRCRLLRNHGMRRRYHHESLGFNMRLSDLHAAVGVVQLKRLRSFQDRRRHNADYLNERLRSVRTPMELPGYGHAWHQYTIRLGRRDDAVARLAAVGVGTGVFYPLPAHEQPHIREVLGDVSLPVAEEASRQVLSLPVHPALSDEELAHVAGSVNALPHGGGK